MCDHPTAEYWREKLIDVDDAELANDLRWLWAPTTLVGPPYASEHHDYVTARNLTLREARKRGFDVKAILGT